ncbi:UDP-N-acetylglucosamine (UAA) transporter family, partial [Zea mays]
MCATASDQSFTFSCVDLEVLQEHVVTVFSVETCYRSISVLVFWWPCFPVKIYASSLGIAKGIDNVILSVICTATGVLIAALGDFSFDLYGHCMALTSVFFQTMYLILVEKSGAEDGLSSVDLMFYNNILSLPFLFFLIIATGEFPHSLTILPAK